MRKLINDAKALSSQPDPYIIEETGNYYIYSTNINGVACFSSPELSNFQYRGLVLEVPGEKEFWAPAVIKIGAKFYMYYSSIPLESEDVHEQRIKVAVADNPLGPFSYERDLLPPFSIDPHVVIYKNELYIFYSVNDYEAERAGTYIVLDKMLNPLQVEGKPVAVVKPTMDEEIFAYDRFKKGQHWHTIEGAFYFNKGNYHYLMYSGGSYKNDTYFIGYSYAFGDVSDLRELTFRKYPDDFTYRPLINKNEEIEGAGHNSLIKENDNYYMVFHARDRGTYRPDADTRSARILKLKIDKEIITVNEIGSD